MDRLRHASVVRFGTYEIDLHSGEFRKAGVRVRVQQQPLKLLQTLLEHPGEVVTREELRNRIWPNEAFGDLDQAVNVAIAKLRAALGDSADNPRFVVGVMLDAPNGDVSGGQTAAPLFHDLASYLVQRYNIPVSTGTTPFMTLVAQA